MLAALLVLASTPPTVAAVERTPLAIVISKPTAARAGLAPTAVVGALEQTIEAQTDLNVVELEARQLEDCEGDVGCMTARLPSPQPAYLLLITCLTREAHPDRVATMLVDVGAVPKCKADDAACRDRAIRVQTSFEKLEGEADWRNWISDFVARRLRSEFESTKHWGELGGIDLVADLDGATVELDKREVGVVASGGARIVDIRPGSHELTLVRPDGKRIVTNLDVAGGQSLRHEFALARWATARSVATYTGLGVAALGAVLTIFAATADRGAVACRPTPCAGAGFITLETLLSGPIESGETSANDGVIDALPLGYSLLLAGGTIAGLVQLLGSDDDPPWLEIAIGLGVGVLSYSVSTLAD